jgi:hypothetical protein
LNKSMLLHQGNKKNTYRRAAALPFPVTYHHPPTSVPPLVQLPEVAVTLKQSMLHSLTDFIMPPNLLHHREKTKTNTNLSGKKACARSWQGKARRVGTGRCSSSPGRRWPAACRGGGGGRRSSSPCPAGPRCVSRPRPRSALLCPCPGSPC